jgi:hypothetical protein
MRMPSHCGTITNPFYRKVFFASLLRFDNLLSWPMIDMCFTHSPRFDKVLWVMNNSQCAWIISFSIHLDAPLHIYIFKFKFIHIYPLQPNSNFDSNDIKCLWFYHTFILTLQTYGHTSQLEHYWVFPFNCIANLGPTSNFWKVKGWHYCIDA